MNAPPPTTPEAPATANPRRRNGFVARLPKELRDKINVMLLDGVPYRKIIESLGENGKHLDDDHLGSWFEGGYKDWLLDLDRRDALRATREAALDLLQQQAANPVQDAGRTIAAAQLYELLLSFNPQAFAAALSTKPELYLRLISALTRLCEGEATTGHRRTQQALAATKLQPEPDPSRMPTGEELQEILRAIKVL